MGNIEFCNIRKPRDLLQKQLSGSLPLGTEGLNFGFAPLAKPAAAIETIWSGVWWPKETFLTIQWNVVIVSDMEYLNTVSHPPNKAELNLSLRVVTIFGISGRYFPKFMVFCHAASFIILSKAGRFCIRKLH